jgi:hypothetical protein
MMGAADLVNDFDFTPLHYLVRRLLTKPNENGP